MPIAELNQVLITDPLDTGRQKFNTSLDLVRIFVNAIAPSDINTLLVGGKINPVYLDEFVTSVTAADVSVADSGGNFIADDLESVLVELFDAIAAPATGTGDVVGPASAVNERIAVFNGTTGKLIKDGGTLISELATSAQGALASTAVQPARSILTTHSLQNGGDLSANRTLSLVGDEPTPGNNKVYGTDGTGTRGWKDDPIGGTGTATSTSVSASRAITNDDHNKILLCTGTITLTLPAGLNQDLQVIILNVGSGIVSFALSGGSTSTPNGVVLDNSTGAEITATTIINVSNNWYIASARQDTVTVLYSAGWPVSRPDAIHVLAIGHTSAPTWLTSEDVWFENVV